MCASNNNLITHFRYFEEDTAYAMYEVVLYGLYHAYLQENRAFVSLNILEYPRYSNILDFLGITCRYWLLEVKSFA